MTAIGRMCGGMGGGVSWVISDAAGALLTDVKASLVMDMVGWTVFCQWGLEYGVKEQSLKPCVV